MLFSSVFYSTTINHSTYNRIEHKLFVFFREMLAFFITTSPMPADFKYPSTAFGSRINQLNIPNLNSSGPYSQSFAKHNAQITPNLADLPSTTATMLMLFVSLPVCYLMTNKVFIDLDGLSVYSFACYYCLQLGRRERGDLGLGWESH